MFDSELSIIQKQIKHLESVHVHITDPWARIEISKIIKELDKQRLSIIKKLA